MPIIKFKSSDEVTFEVDLKVAMYCGIIKKMLDELPVSGDGDVFHLPTVKSDTLNRIITWATHHSQNNDLAANGLPPVESDSEEETELSSWELEFLKMDMKALYELNLAAETLEIGGLSDITSKAAADIVKGMSVEEIRTMFNIEADLTFEEQKQILMENDLSELFEDEDDA